MCKCGCHSRLIIGAHIASDIRSTLREELGITSCAGIAHNKVLAKMVGEVHKPNQQTLLYPGHTEELLMKRNFLRKIPGNSLFRKYLTLSFCKWLLKFQDDLYFYLGFGHSICKRLAEIGVETISDLRDLPLAILSKMGATNATAMKNLCLGIDPSPVIPSGQPQVCLLHE